MYKSISDTKYQKNLQFMFLKLLHYVVAVTLFAFAWFFFRYRGIPAEVGRGFRYNFFTIALYALLLFFFNRTYNSYLLGYSRIRALTFAQFLSQLFSTIIVYFIVSIAWAKFRNPISFFIVLVPQLFLDALWSYFGNGYYFKVNPPRKTILIYRNALDRKRIGSIKGKPTERLYHIEEELQYDGYSFQAIREKLSGFDAVFVAGVHSRCRNGIAKYCKEEGIPGFFLPHIGDVIMQEAHHIQSFDSPVLFVDRKSLRPEYVIGKRLFDIVTSFCAIILLSPCLLLTALVIRLYDGGPAIYKQTRLTQDGREFIIYKFRSMRVDAEKDGVARLSTGENDERITPIGRIIREIRLDELPQLINILKGDMSVVGPRPERPEIAEKYCEYLPDFKLRLQVKAGLTGYAQVYGKYNIDPYEKLEFDLLYINDMSFITDLKLIFATFGILFSKKSTEGVSVNSLTAMDYDNEQFRADDSSALSDYWIN